MATKVVLKAPAVKEKPGTQLVIAEAEQAATFSPAQTQTLS